MPLFLYFLCGVSGEGCEGLFECPWLCQTAEGVIGKGEVSRDRNITANQYVSFKPGLRSTSYPDTNIQGDNRVDLNFRPQIQAALFYLNKLHSDLAQMRNMVSFIWWRGGDKDFLQAPLVSVHPEYYPHPHLHWFLSVCECNASMASYFAKAGSPLIWGQPVQVHWVTLHQWPCHLPLVITVAMQQSLGVTPPPFSWKPLNSKAFASFPMSKSSNLQGKKKPGRDFSAGNFYFQSLQSLAKVREHKELDYSLGVKEGKCGENKMHINVSVAYTSVIRVVMAKMVRKMMIYVGICFRISGHNLT